MNEMVTYIPPFTRSVTRSQSGSQYIPQETKKSFYAFLIQAIILRKVVRRRVSCGYKCQMVKQHKGILVIYLKFEFSGQNRQMSQEKP